MGRCSGGGHRSTVVKRQRVSTYRRPLTRIDPGRGNRHNRPNGRLAEDSRAPGDRCSEKAAKIGKALDGFLPRNRNASRHLRATS
jgi:hypothetical protein